MSEVEVLEGNVRLEDVLPIKIKMQEELAKGNRFVSFLSENPALTKDDFTAFKSLFSAQEHAYENTTDVDVFTVRSIPVIEKEMDRLLNNSLYKNITMDANVLSFNENQLKRVGMAEAFTPELQEKMQNKQPVIEHPFKKEYDGDKVEAMLHLRKSATSDHYFLNKFDLSLQKEGTTAAIKQTFYIGARKQNDSEDATKQLNKTDQKYTLKEAYNLLAGRPVDKMLVSAAGEQYQAWEKLNPNKVLANGNHEIKRYTSNYGFDLAKTMENYSIKELKTESYKESLEASLRRGNLQKATFVDKEGKEEKLYVSPNITMGTLNIYGQDKKPLSLDKQLENGYTKPEFGEAVKERLQKINQQHKPEDNGQKLTSKLPDQTTQGGQAANLNKTTDKKHKTNHQQDKVVKQVKKSSHKPKRG